MKFEDYLRVLRERWILVVATTLLGVLVALAVSLLATPKYVARTQLFVTVPAAIDVTDSYQGSLFSQQRVASYAKLLTGESLAQQTVDQLDLNMTAEELAKHVKAKVTPETVLIDLSVNDPSPDRAANIANALSDGLARNVANLEKPYGIAEPASRVVVTQYASVPKHQVSPRKKMNLISGAVIGLIAGFGLALLRERFDKSVGNRDEVEELTGAYVLATIPHDEDAPHGRMVDFEGQSTSISEAYRFLGANFQALDDTLPRVTVVTSPADGVEKTATAANLGRALAEAGNTVVLVDGDLRASTLSRFFDKEGAEGLSTVLQGNAMLPRAVQSTRFRGLKILGSGPAAANPSEMLGCMGLADVVDSLRVMFDHVIIDTPSLMQFADAVLVSRRADGVVLVIRQGATTREQLAQAADELDSGSATLLGTVMTAPRKGRIFRRRNSARGTSGKDTKNGENARSHAAAEDTGWQGNGAGRHKRVLESRQPASMAGMQKTRPTPGA